MGRRVGFLSVLAMVVSLGCNDDSSGGSSLEQAEEVTVTGVSVDEAFAENGQFTVGFVAEDGEGNPLLAGGSGSSAPPPITFSVKVHGGWKSIATKAVDGVDCMVAAPAGTTCTLTTVTATEPAAGSGNVAGGVIIDDSGSMSGSDPQQDRVPAANAFIDSVCDDASNMVAAFDFGRGGNLGFSVTRDLMTANGVLDTNLEGGRSMLPYAECTPANVALAQEAVEMQVVASGGTPLWTSVLEVCTDMVDRIAPGEQLEGRALAMLVLSDGQPGDSGLQMDAETCLADNGVTACTVGLGPGSELACACETDMQCQDTFRGDTCSGGFCGESFFTCTSDVDCFGSRCLPGGICQSGACGADVQAVDALKSLARAGNCVYSAATSAAALEPIFAAVGTAISSGQNFAESSVSPIPAPGTTVEGTITVGTASAVFSFVVPQAAPPVTP